MPKRFQQKKRPPEMDVIIPSDENELKNQFLIDGERHFRECKFELALAKYQKITCDDANYWKAKVNEMLCEIRLHNYDSSLLVFNYINENCTDKKQLALAYLNRGDCLIGQAVMYSNKNLEKEAHNSYRKAYEFDANSIVSVYHFWFAENARGRHQNAKILRSIVENHKDFGLLNQEQIRYFMNHPEEKIKIFKEDYVMSWKKMVLIGIYIIIFSIIVIADGGLNGGR